MFGQLMHADDVDGSLRHRVIVFHRTTTDADRTDKHSSVVQVVSFCSSHESKGLFPANPSLQHLDLANFLGRNFAWIVFQDYQVGQLASVQTANFFFGL